MSVTSNSRCAEYIHTSSVIVVAKRLGCQEGSDHFTLLLRKTSGWCTLWKSSKFRQVALCSSLLRAELW